MNYEMKPISLSTTLSLALHAVLAIAIMQSRPLMQATGAGLEIELVSSVFISDQDETERAARSAESVDQKQHQVIAPDNSRVETSQRKPEVNAASTPTRSASVAADETSSIDNDAGEQVRTRSTSSAQQRHSIIELLHSKISEHKQYPYLARRQRREGVATIEFVLQPDGAVVNPRLIHSSRTKVLDKAALDAVKSIDPFSPAGDYIDRPEVYQVDVVFDVM